MIVLFVSCKEDVPAKVTSSMGICILLCYFSTFTLCCSSQGLNALMCRPMLCDYD